MLILELALAAMLTTKGTASKTADVPPRLVVGSNAELVSLIKKDIESISGPNSVDVSIDHDTLFSVRIAVPSFRTEVCNPIYDVELKLYRYFPDLNFDFYLRSKP
jgi:hypothetical protein